MLEILKYPASLAAPNISAIRIMRVVAVSSGKLVAHAIDPHAPRGYA
jgi:hypothetical protein